DELERQKKVEEEARKKHEEEARQKKLAEEKKREEEEERLRKEKFEAERKKQEDEELKKKKLQTELAAKEETERQSIIAKKKLEEEAAKKKADEELEFVKWSAVEKEWYSYKKIIVDINTEINDVVKDNKELKSFTFKSKREIKKKMAQMSTSLAQLKKIMEDIKGILTTAFQFNEVAYKWLLNFMAKAIVNQAETEVIVNIQAANAIGILATHMMSNYTGFKDILLARIIKKCPYLVGYTCNIDTEEGRRRMGWKYLENANKWEDETAYAERMGGICGIWSVVTQVRFGPTSNVHPYPISNSWKMLARQVDTPTEKLTNAHFCVVAAWWDISASKFLMAFGRQGDKLMELIWNDWTNSVCDKRFAAAARLRLLGEEWRSTGKAPGLKPLE
ncbi:GLE1-domain-containing protein, partial [Nadsonia fulvescens var. elongata DSM 6958]